MIMSFFRRVFRALFNRITLTILLLLLLSLLIWFGGPTISVAGYPPLGPTWIRWTLIGVVWGIWFLKLFISWWRSRNVNAALLGQLAKMQSSAKPTESAAGTEEVAELNKRFKDAADILKKTRFSSNEKGGLLSGLSKQYVYQLPWYAFIGAPGSGKTTALINAGLTFPLAEQFGKAAIRGIGGTRNCDWWFTNEAVLIDTAGRYTTQESNQEVDKAEWQGFLTLLKKFRPRQPLNGVLMTVSVADLLQMSAQEREVHAATLKARLNELREGLGVQFPVYVLVTKADLLSGFTEYFLNYGREERAQVWGFTLPYDPKSTEPINPRAAFTREFDLLYKRVNDGMHQRLLDEPDLSRRALAYTLPQQFAGVKDVLSRLLGGVFSDSKFNEQPMLRGVYFTSGTQEGTPFDRVLGAIQRTFRVESRVRATEAAAGTGKSYFLQDLLQKVIFQEHFIAGRNLKAERKRVLLQRVGYAACALLFTGANIGWWFSYRNNMNYIAEVDKKTEELRTTATALPTAVSEDAPALAGVLSQARTVAVSDKFPIDSPPWSYRYGLYQGNKLDSAAQTTYVRLLEDSLMPRVATRLHTRLRSASGANNEATYDSLKAYLMMHEQNRIKDGFILDYVGRDWVAGLSADVSKEKRVELLSHLESLLATGSFKATSPIDTGLVQQARNELSQLEPARRAYNFIKSRLISSVDIQEFTVNRAAGERAPEVLERRSGQSLNGGGVPGFYSERGYNEHFAKELGKWGAEIALEERWVLGKDTKATALATAANDMQRLDRRIRELYLQDFGNQWLAFLQDVRLKTPRNMTETIERATALGAVDSPLVLLVREVARQTTLINPEGANTGATRVESIKESIRRGVNEVTAATAAIANSSVSTDRIELTAQERFREIRTLAQPEGKARIDQIAKDILDYANSLRNDQIALSNGSTKRSQDAETKLRSTAASTPTPVREIIEGLSQSASAQANLAINANSRSNMAGATGAGCAAVSRSYPFNRSAAQDAFPNDFAQVFGPSGSIKQAFDTIASAVDTSRTPWVPRPGPDGAAAGRAQDLRSFQQAQEIRETFFAKGGTPSYELDVRVTTSSAERIEIDFDGTTVASTDDVKRVPWPGPKNSEKVVLTASGKAPATIQSGFWALHRMADKSGAQPTAGSNAVQIVLNVDGKDVRIELRARSFRHPITMPALRGFACPGR
jgi:type VI secretion system protein ImpL